MSTTALQKALDGQKLTDTQAKGALAQAVDKITTLKNKADKTKEQVGTAAAAVVNTLEMQGSVFLASMAEGYFGKDKMKPGGVVDVRAPVAIALVGWGVYDAMSGNTGSASHLMALGNGVGASFLASAGHSAGEAMANRYAGGQPQQQPPAPQNPIPPPAGIDSQQGEYDDDDRDVREVVLSPDPVPRDRRRRRRSQGGRPNRFRRAQAE